MLGVPIFLGSNISGISRSYNLTAAGFCLFTLLGRCTIVVLKLVYLFTNIGKVNKQALQSIQ